MNILLKSLYGGILISLMSVARKFVKVVVSVRRV